MTSESHGPIGIGAWRSLVAYQYGVLVVAGSNPVAPMRTKERTEDTSSVRSFLCDSSARRRRGLFRTVRPGSDALRE